MDNNETMTLPTCPVERRRVQNRHAQRKYRSRRHQQQVRLALADSPALSVRNQQPQQPQFPESISPTDSCDDFGIATGQAFSFSIDTLFGTVTTAGLTPPRLAGDMMVPYITPYDTSTGLSTTTGSPFDRGIPASFEATGSTQRVQCMQFERDMVAGATVRSEVPAGRKSSSCQDPAEDFLSTLHIAAFRGRAAIVSTLLDHGLDTHEPDSKGRTPLHLAAMNGHADVVRILLERGAAINMPDGLGRTPIHWATLQQKEESLKALIEYGADVNATDRNLWTATHICVERGWQEGLAHVLRAGGDAHRRAKKCSIWKSEEPSAD